MTDEPTEVPQRETSEESIPVSIPVSGIDILVYHAALLQLVQATQGYVAVLDKVAEAAKRADPGGDAQPRPEEGAAVRTVQELLRAVVERNPGLAGVFAYASGNVQLAIPG